MTVERMREWIERPDSSRIAIALASILALTVGYVGASVYLAHAQPAVAQAAEAGVASPVNVSSPLSSGALVIHGTGDVNLDPAELGLVRSSFNAPWTGVRELFLSDDVSVVNLECAASELGVPEEKEYTFRCPGGLHAMRSAGVDVANMGNNHAGDYGTEALLDARASAIAAGLAPVGAGRDAREANAPAVFERKGRKVAVLGFGGVLPTPAWIATDGRPGMADGYDTASMVRAVRAAEAIADVVIVTIHWGAELDTRPRDDDVSRAHALIDAGADAIFGHHAHVLQPVEFYRRRPIFYGLGNFVWPRGGPTGVARVVVPEDGAIRACLLPGEISGGRPTLTGTTCGTDG